MENNNGRGIFYGVMGVATLVVAIIGATFAFFAASASGGENAVAANSVSLAGTLELTEVLDARDQLIPVAQDIMKGSYNQNGEGNKAKCKGVSKADATATYDMCSTYEFTLKNKANVAQQVYVTFKSVKNEYTNLMYCVYEGAHTTTNTIVNDCKAVPATGLVDEDIISVNVPAATNESTPGTHTYTVVLFINETKGNQTDADSGKTFTGTISATTSSKTSSVTGVLAA